MNSVLKKWTVFIAWILSFFGISVGNFGCVAYGPPDHYEIDQLNSLKREAVEAEKKFKDVKKENSDLSKAIDRKYKELQELKSEKDTLKTLMGNNEK